MKRQTKKKNIIYFLSLVIAQNISSKIYTTKEDRDYSSCHP
jgi:hypothetical protein